MYDWLHIFNTLNEEIFNHTIPPFEDLTEKETTINPDLFLGFEYLRDGSCILNLALSCKCVFKSFLPLINKNLLFRCRTDGPFLIYSPTCLTLLTASAVPFLPSSFTFIIIGSNFTSTTFPNLPSSLTHLIVSNNNVKFPSFSFPPNITHLLWKCPNSNIITIPPNITHLQLLNRSKITDPLPDSLSHLVLYTDNLIIDRLPPSLVSFHMPLHNDLDQTILSLPPLPSSLKSFKVHSRWGKDDSDLILPNNLISLSFGTTEKHGTLGNMPIPDSIKSLSFCGNGLKTITSLPPTLTSLYCSPPCVLQSLLPSSLLHLTFPSRHSAAIHSLPPHLTHLSLPETRNNLHCSLPSSLISLTIQGYNPEISYLSSLTSLHISLHSRDVLSYANDAFLLPLPPTLTNLTLFADQQPFDLPPSLTHLILNGNMRLLALPPLLTHLTLLDRFNQRLPSLPLSLTHLTLRNYFTNPLPDLPPNLTFLSLHCYKTYFHKLPTLPSKLKYLVIPFIAHPLPNIPPSLMWLYCHHAWHSSFPLPSLPPWCHMALQHFYLES